MSKFKEYYLVWFIAFGVMTLFGLLINRDSIDYKLLFLLFFTGIVVPFLLGTLMVWTKNVWTPKRRIKFYNEEPLINLKEFGFININNDYIEGVVNSFNVRVIYDHSYKRELICKIYFEVLEDEEKLLEIDKALRSFSSGINYNGEISIYRELKWKIPNHDIIIEDINSVITFIVNNGIRPTTNSNFSD